MSNNLYASVSDLPSAHISWSSVRNINLGQLKLWASKVDFTR